MKIVAFLQNMWVRDPERLKRAIAQDEAEEPGSGEDLRLRMMEYALFAGCVTGRRLRATFGEQLCDEIVWEETTREIGNNPKTVFPAQPDHIAAVLEKHNPDIVLTFGRIAEHAVPPICVKRGIQKVITAPHPAARQTDTTTKLKGAAQLLNFYIQTHNEIPT